MTPAQASSLPAIVLAAQPGDTIRFADGTYLLSQPLVITTPQLTLRSRSGVRGTVILDGGYTVADIIVIAESGVTIADLTVTHAGNRAIRVAPQTRTSYGTLIHNVHLIDQAGTFVSIEATAGVYADNGVVECSSLQLTDAGRSHVPSGCPVAGIGGAQASNWQILSNTLAGFWCAAGPAAPAIQFAAGSRGTVVDRNTIVNSARGIALGAGENPVDDPDVCRSALWHEHSGRPLRRRRPQQRHRDERWPDTEQRSRLRSRHPAPAVVRQQRAA